MTSEPALALRPAGSRGPGLELCHRSRLHVENGELVLRTRTRTLRLAGIERAVFIDTAGQDRGERMGPTISGSWGEVQLQDGRGTLIGRFAIEDWLPESPVLPKRSVQGEQLLARTGVTHLLRSAGIPIHVVRDWKDPRVARGAGGLTRRTRNLGPGKAFPSWYWTTRLLAGAVWFVTFTLIVFSGSERPALVLVSAVAAFVAPVARLALRAWTRWRLRRYDPVVRERIGPAPAEDAGATPRFRERAELRVQERDLVLRDLGGQEYWFPLTGPHALTTLTLVRDRAGAPVGAELRGPGDQVRAVLPWGPWFAGEGGADGWSRLRRSTRLHVTERSLSGKGTWPKTPVLGSRPIPDSASTARAVSRFPGTIAGVSSTAVMALGSFFSLTWGIRIEDAHPGAGAGATALTLGALGAVLQAIPYALHQLTSRTRLDRPSPGARTRTEQAA
ncbi:hypothetical protein ABZ915_36120 [Streptomyces sp. NPDC046915]|uniref:hypothetical protein n=1 Tax=Streptomyces sp. NPDC046915 TaxID=3155257 RepID=UPI0033FD789B